MSICKEAKTTYGDELDSNMGLHSLKGVSIDPTAPYKMY